MRRAAWLLVTVLTVSLCLAGEPPQLSESTEEIGPPEFRSYMLTRVFKRGGEEILRDIRHGPSSDRTLRMQHVIHDQEVVFSVRETDQGTIVSSSHGEAVSVLQIDVDRDGKRDLLLLLTKGGQEVAEAYLFDAHGFLSPLPAQYMFNEEGNKLHHDIVVKNVQELLSEQDTPGDADEPPH